jgi:hypothetical protein
MHVPEAPSPHERSLSVMSLVPLASGGGRMLIPSITNLESRDGAQVVVKVKKPRLRSQRAAAISPSPLEESTTLDGDVVKIKGEDNASNNASK